VLFAVAGHKDNVSAVSGSHRWSCCYRWAEASSCYCFAEWV